ncbi:MAG: PhzF family phenazine biosynthesis isomerase, partial [Alkalibacterium sp.]
ATVAALYALKTKGLLPEKERLTIETKAGILPVRIHSATENNWQITMTQKPASFEPFNGSRERIAQVIGLNVSDIDGSFPLLYGSTGSWTLLVPVKGLSPFKRMHSFNDQFPEVLERFPDASIHPFCQETIHSANDLHGRHFSSPGTGSIEDPVTGTASGVMGAYFAKFMADEISDSYKIAVEQGQEIGKDGRVYVDVSRQGDNLSVTITGEAVYVKTLNLKV